MTTDALELLSEHRCFDGVQRLYRHDSGAIGLPMRFSAYVPPQAREDRVPVLFYLAGLTCTEETFMIKAGAQRFAARHGLMLVRSEEHTSELQSLMRISYAVFCLKQKTQHTPLKKTIDNDKT